MKRKKNRLAAAERAYRLGKSFNTPNTNLPKFNKQEPQALFHQTFSPTIMECKAPERFIDIINGVGDVVLKDDNLSKQYDFSESLVGKVSKEVKIPVKDKEDANFCLNIMRTACLGYLKQMIMFNRSYEWNKLSNNNKNPKLENIHLTQSWIVSQYKHEYNPWHKHSGHFSGVVYLKIPEKMEEHFQEEIKDHYPASGLIEFQYGSSLDFRSDTYMVKPTLGKMLVFPAWLKHSVYPFYCDGERRSMSFNAHYIVP